MDFTRIDGSIVVHVTVFKEHSVVFSIDIIFWVDSIVTIGIIVGNSFFSNLFDHFTIPSIFTVNTWFEWIGTISGTIFWAVFFSPSVFTG